MKVETFAKPVMVELGGALSFVNVTITVSEETSENVVLCVHDMVGRGQDFAPIAALLAASGYKVVAPDLPGRGRSTRLPKTLYTWHTYLEVLASVMRDHPGKTLIILASGWGGTIALAFEAMWKPRPNRLVLCDLPLDWSFEGDHVAQAWADITALDATSEVEFLAQARRIFERYGACAEDLLLAVTSRMAKVADGSCLDADFVLFETFKADPKKSYSTGNLLTYCRTETVLLQARRLAASQSVTQFEPFLRPGSFAASVAADSFLNLSEPSAALPILGAVLS